MGSKLEQLIEAIEDYVDECKFQTFSSTKILVDKEELMSLLRNLKMKTPNEIKKCQELVDRQEEILNSARVKAEALINNATIQTNELINEHEIMQEAYAQANEIVVLATNQAQEILDVATVESNNMRVAACEYTDDMLAHVENVIASAMESTTFKYDDLMKSLNEYYEVIVSNRAELYPSEETVEGIAE
ncbi:MAG: hypothetical protein R3Y24_00820 [Eubacteriales bacterium]